MFNIVRDRQAAGQAGPEDTLRFDTPVRFDTTLAARLIAGHGELSIRFGALVRRLDGEPEGIAREIRDCSIRLHGLRRTEALWLYPVLARGVLRDGVARRQFMRLRLVMLGLARRVLRLFDELAAAVQQGAATTAIADAALAALADYRARNEAEIYPLYDFIGRQDFSQRHIA
jgi:hypothetical protein